MVNVKSSKILTVLTFFLALNAEAGYELVCRGQQPTSNHRVIYVNCENRQEVEEALGASWQELINKKIAVILQNSCKSSYFEARAMSNLNSVMAKALFMNCNNGLKFIN